VCYGNERGMEVVSHNFAENEFLCFLSLRKAPDRIDSMAQRTDVSTATTTASQIKVVRG